MKEALLYDLDKCSNINNSHGANLLPTATSIAGPLPSPTCSPQYSMGACMVAVASSSYFCTQNNIEAGRDVTSAQRLRAESFGGIFLNNKSGGMQTGGMQIMAVHSPSLALRARPYNRH